MSILSGMVGTMKKKAAGGAGGAIGAIGPNGTAYSAGVFAATGKTLWVANKSLGEASSTLSWGSYGTNRDTSSTTNGMANSTTLASYGQTAHPAAYFCRNLSIGSYGAVWYLPAKDELNQIYTNLTASGKLLAPSGAHADKFTATDYWSSSEFLSNNAWCQNMSSGGPANSFKYDLNRVRAVRSS
jgi:hypothetical protein